MKSMFSETQTIRPARSLRGSLTLPGDKSISHRYAMLAGLAEGTSRLANFSSGADPHSTLACMAALGAEVTASEDRTVTIRGVGGSFREPAGPLDCGNSGSTMRMLSGLLAAHPHTFTLIGDASLTQRPMERIRKPIEQFFVDKTAAGISLTDGHAPITIRGGLLRGTAFTAPIPSAQVKTAVLFAGMQAEGTTTFSEAIRTRDHTEHALRAFGATLTHTGETIEIRGPQELKAVDATVPGDLSSAAFFMCAALLFPESHLVLDALGMNPSRAALLDAVTALGAKIKVLAVEELHGELTGTIQVNVDPEAQSRSAGRPLEISGAWTAQLIDELPVLAAVAPYTQCGLRVRDARELRVKESDRIALVARNIRAMGGVLTEYDDGFDIAGNQQLHGAEIDSGHDHRIAMAFSVAALRAAGDTLIHGAEAAVISFPEFYASLDALSQR